MRCAERVVDVHVAERGQLLAERRVVLLLALVEAQVLHHEHVAVAQRRGLRLRVGPHRVGGEHDGLAEKLGQALGGGAQRERFLEALAGRSSEVAHEDDARALLHQTLDGGQRGADARVVGDGAVLHGHVEVDAHERALAARVQLVDGFDVGHTYSFFRTGWRSKSARSPEVPKIAVKTWRSVLGYVSQAWSGKVGCLGASQRRAVPPVVRPAERKARGGS